MKGLIFIAGCAVTLEQAEKEQRAQEGLTGRLARLVCTGRKTCRCNDCSRRKKVDA